MEKHELAEDEARRIAQHEQIKGKLGENVKNAWYKQSVGDDGYLHPSKGETRPNFTGPKPPFERLDPCSKSSSAPD